MATKSIKPKTPKQKIENIKKQNAKRIKAIGKQVDSGEVSRKEANRLTNRAEKVATSRMKSARRKKNKR